MPDPITPEEKKDEKPQEAPQKEEGYDYAKDHLRTPEQIVREPVVNDKPNGEDKSGTEDKPSDTKPAQEKPADTQKPTNPLDEAKKYLEEQRKADKIEAERIARETTEKHLKQTEEQKTQAVKDAEEDKPIWERENREPKDWKEVAAENRRIAKREVLRDIRAEQQATKAAQDKQKAESEAGQQAQLQTINEKIGQEMEELYQGGYLPRPQSADPTDAGEVAKAKLFELGVKINQERKDQGLPPETSIAKIFFMNTDKLKPKAPEQPAGADAPVSGAQAAVPKQNPDEYVYQRDHNKSLEQLRREAMGR